MTYSVGSLGINANNLFANKVVKISDAQAPAISQPGAMMQGTQFLGQNPDGSQSYYRFDSERSTPGNPILVKIS